MKIEWEYFHEFRTYELWLNENCVARLVSRNGVYEIAVWNAYPPYGWTKHDATYNNLVTAKAVCLAIGVMTI